MQTTKNQICRRLQENKNFKRGKLLPELANTAKDKETGQQDLVQCKSLTRLIKSEHPKVNVATPQI